MFCIGINVMTIMSCISVIGEFLDPFAKKYSELKIYKSRVNKTSAVAEALADKSANSTRNRFRT